MEHLRDRPDPTNSLHHASCETLLLGAFSLQQIHVVPAVIADDRIADDRHFGSGNQSVRGRCEIVMLLTWLTQKLAKQTHHHHTSNPTLYRATLRHAQELTKTTKHIQTIPEPSNTNALNIF